MRLDTNIGEYFAVWQLSEKRYADFIYRILYRDIFYVSIIVTMIAVLFNILIDNFSELRIDIINRSIDINEVCFICGTTKEATEKESVDFSKHKDVDHNIWYYLEFLICLKFNNKDSANAVDSYITECVKAKSTAWFPVNK